MMLLPLRQSTKARRADGRCSQQDQCPEAEAVNTAETEMESLQGLALRGQTWQAPVQGNPQHTPRTCARGSPLAGSSPGLTL